MTRGTTTVPRQTGIGILLTAQRCHRDSFRRLFVCACVERKAALSFSAAKGPKQTGSSSSISIRVVVVISNKSVGYLAGGATCARMSISSVPPSSEKVAHQYYAVTSNEKHVYVSLDRLQQQHEPSVPTKPWRNEETS